MSDKMRLKLGDIKVAHTVLNKLGDQLLKDKNAGKAVEVGLAVRKMQPEIDVLRQTSNALIVQFGEKDKEGRTVITVGTNGHKDYNDAMGEVLDREVSLNIEPIQLSQEDVASLDFASFLDIIPVVNIVEEI